MESRNKAPGYKLSAEGENALCMRDEAKLHMAPVVLIDPKDGE